MTETTSVIHRTWNNHPITQRVEDQYLDATKMARSCGKLWGHYWATKAAKDFAESLATDIGIPISALIQATKGGAGQQGTFIHPDLAMHFAGWLDPMFAVQVCRWVRELLTTGSVHLDGHPNANEQRLDRLEQLLSILIQGQQQLTAALTQLATQQRQQPQQVQYFPEGKPMGVQEFARGLWPDANKRQKEQILSELQKRCRRRGIVLRKEVDNGPYSIEETHLGLVVDAVKEVRAKYEAPLFSFAKRKQAFPVESN